MADLISIVIPVYNVENYLCDCLDSIVNQTYRNIEVLLINDGSTDHSKEICDFYASRDDRVRVINKINGGSSEARNVGIDSSKGDWIVFIDSDDIVHKKYCELLLLTALKTKSSLVFSDYYKFYDDKEISERRKSELAKIESTDVLIYTGLEGIERYYYRELPGYACCNIISHELLRELRYPVGRLFEDAFFIPRLITKTDKVVYLKKDIYFYRQRKGSNVNGNFSPKIFDQFYMVKEIPEDLLVDKSVGKAIKSKLFISGLDVLRKIPTNQIKKFDQIEDIKRVLSSVAPTVAKDNNNSYFVRLLALFYRVNPSLVVSICKLRKYIRVKRV